MTFRSGASSASRLWLRGRGGGRCRCRPGPCAACSGQVAARCDGRVLYDDIVAHQQTARPEQILFPFLDADSEPCRVAGPHGGRLRHDPAGFFFVGQECFTWLGRWCLGVGSEAVVGEEVGTVADLPSFAFCGLGYLGDGLGPSFFGDAGEELVVDGRVVEEADEGFAAVGVQAAEARVELRAVGFRGVGGDAVDGVELADAVPAARRLFWAARWCRSRSRRGGPGAARPGGV